MPKKYNIALLPLHSSDEIIEFAKKFSTLSENYMLGEKSLPHVTLCQFYAEEKQVNEVWENACNTLTEHSLELTFGNFSCISFDESTFWVSLLPDKVDALNDMYSEIIKIVKPFNNKLFDPHMTLFNTKNKEYKTLIKDDLSQYSSISDCFILALGECDEIGQFTRLVESYQLSKSLSFT
ncbi:2'-5' RNA ligase family protein [Legionella maceachernii]|uniref:2',5' RNA ligase family n=1 Tax=Legionella maceachernii TaxID=466 RepID=A0A0W0VVQ6_9GAMM|nr:hypothetical protein [Legionella maceachernii]KTD23945.1 hypothetical protein Lmac_2818 [Legionella maceachernii]SKA18800.1 hypothetical protein SAMN02745128_02444 [Legionella maceachernii]SUP04482.1 2'-5' RNA ligase [Legionella maceachernii]